MDEQQALIEDCAHAASAQILDALPPVGDPKIPDLLHAIVAAAILAYLHFACEERG